MTNETVKKRRAGPEDVEIGRKIRALRLEREPRREQSSIASATIVHN